MKSSLRSKVPLAVALAVVFVVVALVFALPIGASHAAYPHNVSIHSSTDYEWVCVDTKNSTADWWTTFDKVRDTLVWDTPTPGGYLWDDTAWDSSTGSYRIYFGFDNVYQCSDSPNLSSMRMRVYVYTDTTYTSCKGTACVDHYGQINGGHNYTYEHVTLASRHVTGTTALHHHVINHEFGHTLGLDDPPDRTGTNCGQSVMHSDWYGCTDYEFAQYSDISSVISIANGP